MSDYLAVKLYTDYIWDVVEEFDDEEEKEKQRTDDCDIWMSELLFLMIWYVVFVRESTIKHTI